MGDKDGQCTCLVKHSFQSHNQDEGIEGQVSIL